VPPPRKSEDLPAGLEKKDSAFAAAQILGKRSRIVDLRFARTEKQRHRALADQFAQLREFLTARFKLGKIALAEFVPAFRFVAVPVPEFVARRDFLQPERQRCFLLADAARPYPIDEHARAIVPGR